MVDLKGQYASIKPLIDDAIMNVISSTKFINGPEVKAFQKELANYLGVKHVITCGNGTDALQISMMALGLKPGDEKLGAPNPLSCRADADACVGCGAFPGSNLL